jgi:hypothetical protein
MAIFSGPEIVNDGLVLHLDAANLRSYPSSGTLWNDLSNLGNNGTLVNGVGFNNVNNGTMVFDGVNDYINCGVIPGIDSSATEFTIDIWLRPKVKTAKCIIENGTGYTTNTFYMFQENATYFTFEVYGAGGFDAVYANFEYQINTWYNLVGVWSAGNRVNLYSNGVIANGTYIGSARPSVITGNTNIIIGSRTGGSFHFNGDIPQAKIYTRALTATEIKQNFEATRSRYGI